jgi:hypothetical protein
MFASRDRRIEVDQVPVKLLGVTAARQQSLAERQLSPTLEHQ